MPKRQQQQQETAEIQLDESEFQQRRPPVPLPRTLTPQKSREAPTAVEKEISRAFLTPSYVEKETKVDKRVSPSKDVPLATKKDTKVDKQTVFKPIKDILQPSSGKETKVDKHTFLSPSKDAPYATKKETKVDKRAVFTPAKDLLPPAPEKEKKVEKRVFLTPGKETNVDKGGFVAPPPAASDPRPSGGRRRFFKTPEALKTPSYLKPTSASQNRASPRKIDPRYFPEFIFTIT